MRKLFKLGTAITLLAGNSIAIAHPGHDAGGLLANAAPAFTDTQYLVGIALVCIVVYQLIKRTN